MSPPATGLRSRGVQVTAKIKSSSVMYMCGFSDVVPAMADAGPNPLLLNTAKEKKVRTKPRVRRRLRKPSTTSRENGVNADSSTADSPKEPRWVKVSTLRKSKEMVSGQSSVTMLHAQQGWMAPTAASIKPLMPTPVHSPATACRGDAASSVSGEFWGASDELRLTSHVRGNGRVVDGAIMTPRQDGDAATYSLGSGAPTDPPLQFWCNVPEPTFRKYAMEEAHVTAGRIQAHDPDDSAMWNSMPMHYGEELEPLLDESGAEIAERKRWQEWAKHAAEQERQRRVKILENMDREECRERLARRAWALSAMDEEQRRRAGQQFLLSIEGTNWFQETISSVDLDYEVACPYSSLGCRHICLRTELEDHLAKGCRYNKEPEDSESDAQVHASEYEVVCPNAILGCDHSCSRSSLNEHLETCRFAGPNRTEEAAERERSLQMVLQQSEEERARRVADDARGDWQSDSVALKTRQFLHRLLEDQMKTALIILHKEILEFAARCRLLEDKRKQALENTLCQFEGVVRLLWPSSSVLPYGSWASGMMTPDSDVDLVVCLRSGGSAHSQTSSGDSVLPGASPAGKTWATEEHSHDQNRSRPNTPDRSRDKGSGTGERDCRSSQEQQQADATHQCAATKSTAEVRRITSPEPSRVAIQLDANDETSHESGFTWHDDTQGDAKAKEIETAFSAASTTSSVPASADSTHADRRAWERRRRWGRKDGRSMLGRIQDLADHLRQHANFIEVVKVVDMARIPVIKAIAVCDAGVGDEKNSTVKFDITIDGPTHTGVAANGFVSYLADHLPNLVPLTLVLKSLLQNHGMNDPFTGGLSSYGLILMVAFALLRRDHFPPSPAGPCIVDQDFVERCHSDSTPRVPHGDSEEMNKNSKDVDAPGTYPPPPESSPTVETFTPPPSPGHEDSFPSSYCISSPPKSEPTIATVNKRVVASVGRQRGFWQPSSLAEHGADSWVRGGSGARWRSKPDKAPIPTEGKSRMLWDRPTQQHWVGSRTARAILMQDFYAGAPTPQAAAAESGVRTTPMGHLPGPTTFPSKPKLAGESTLPIASHGVPPPPPPPLPQPAENDGVYTFIAPCSPYITSGGDPVLGELLLDFLHLFGEDFDVSCEGFSVRGGGFRFNCHENPPHPQAGDPIVIEDPLNCMNNVGRSCFAINQVQRIFFEALTTLKATMVRVNQDGKEVLVSGSSSPKTNSGILRHICTPPGGGTARATNTS